MTTVLAGRTRHRRVRPKVHSFEFPLSMVMFDADALGGSGPSSLVVDDGVTIERRDLFDGVVATRLGDAVRDLVGERSGDRPDGPVRTLTIARSTGHAFNPLSVHWILDSDEVVTAVVLEVTNTPWKERHHYVLDARPERRCAPGLAAAERTADGSITARFAKELHVSPFGHMDETYVAVVSPPRSSVHVRLDNLGADGHAVMMAELELNADAPRRRGLRGLSRRVWLAIHWNAVRLWAKRVPVVRHPDRHPNRRPDQPPR